MDNLNFNWMFVWSEIGLLRSLVEKFQPTREIDNLIDCGSSESALVEGAIFPLR